MVDIKPVKPFFAFAYYVGRAVFIYKPSRLSRTALRNLRNKVIFTNWRQRHGKEYRFKVVPKDKTKSRWLHATTGFSTKKLFTGKNCCYSDPFFRPVPQL